MKIAAINVTYNQPRLLGRAIECFNRQDYDDRRLLILDDAGQIQPQEGGYCASGPRWKLISHRFRYPDLGTKRNVAVRLALEYWPDVDAVCPFDDDDLFLPNHLAACVAALQNAQWCQPSQILIQADGRFKRMLTYREEAPHLKGYHSSWAFRREAFETLGGYAQISNGEDAELAGRTLKLLGPSADTISPEFPGPTYCYTQSNQHLSAMEPDGYEKLGKQRIEPVNHLDISWPEDYSKWPIGDEVLPRRW